MQVIGLTRLRLLALVITSRAGRAGGVFITGSTTGHASATEVSAVAATEIPAVAATEIPAAAVAVVLPPQGCKSLLLGMCVYVCADDEANDVEEGHPGVLGKELLGECQGDWRYDPAHLHDGHETGLDGSAHLVEGAGACNDGHGDEVYRVLDGGDLVRVSAVVLLQGAYLLTMRLLMRICIILALRLLRPRKIFWRMLMRTCPSGALMKAPYRAILGTREVK